MLPYLDTLIALKSAGYHIAIADIAAMELGDLLELEKDSSKPSYFNLDAMLNALPKFISDVTPFWPGRTEVQEEGDLRPRRNRVWQNRMQILWAVYLKSLRERKFRPQKFSWKDGREIDIGSMMHKTKEMKQAERDIWLDQIEKCKQFTHLPYERQIEFMQEMARLAHPHIKNAHRRLDLRVHRIIYMTNEIVKGARQQPGKNDAMDNHLDFSQFYPAVVITNDGGYIQSCIASESKQAANIRTTDQMVTEWKQHGEIRLRWSSSL